MAIGELGSMSGRGFASVLLSEPRSDGGVNLHFVGLVMFRAKLRVADTDKSDRVGPELAWSIGFEERHGHSMPLL